MSLRTDAALLESFYGACDETVVLLSLNIAGESEGGAPDLEKTLVLRWANRRARELCGLEDDLHHNLSLLRGSQRSSDDSALIKCLGVSERTLARVHAALQSLHRGDAAICNVQNMPEFAAVLPCETVPAGDSTPRPRSSRSRLARFLPGCLSPAQSKGSRALAMVKGGRAAEGLTPALLVVLRPAASTSGRRLAADAACSSGAEALAAAAVPGLVGAVHPSPAEHPSGMAPVPPPLVRAAVSRDGGSGSGSGGGTLLPGSPLAARGGGGGASSLLALSCLQQLPVMVTVLSADDGRVLLQSAASEEYYGRRAAGAAAGPAAAAAAAGGGGAEPGSETPAGASAAAGRGAELRRVSGCGVDGGSALAASGGLLGDLFSLDPAKLRAVLDFLQLAAAAAAPHERELQLESAAHQQAGAAAASEQSAPAVALISSSNAGKGFPGSSPLASPAAVAAAASPLLDSLLEHSVFYEDGGVLPAWEGIIRVPASLNAAARGFSGSASESGSDISTGCSNTGASCAANQQIRTITEQQATVKAAAEAAVSAAAVAAAAAAAGAEAAGGDGGPDVSMHEDRAAMAVAAAGGGGGAIIDIAGGSARPRKAAAGTSLWATLSAAAAQLLAPRMSSSRRNPQAQQHPEAHVTVATPAGRSRNLSFGLAAAEEHMPAGGGGGGGGSSGARNVVVGAAGGSSVPPALPHGTAAAPAPAAAAAAAALHAAAAVQQATAPQVESAAGLAARQDEQHARFGCSSRSKSFSVGRRAAAAGGALHHQLLGSGSSSRSMRQRPPSGGLLLRTADFVREAAAASSVPEPVFEDEEAAAAAAALFSIGAPAAEGTAAMSNYPTSGVGRLGGSSTRGGVAAGGSSRRSLRSPAHQQQQQQQQRQVGASPGGSWAPMLDPLATSTWMVAYESLGGRSSDTAGIEDLAVSKKKVPAAAATNPPFSTASSSAGGGGRFAVSSPPLTTAAVGSPSAKSCCSPPPPLTSAAAAAVAAAATSNQPFRSLQSPAHLQPIIPVAAAVATAAAAVETAALVLHATPSKGAPAELPSQLPPQQQQQHLCGAAADTAPATVAVIDVGGGAPLTRLGGHGIKPTGAPLQQRRTHEGYLQQRRPPVESHQPAVAMAAAADSEHNGQRQQSSQGAAVEASAAATAYSSSSSSALATARSSSHVRAPGQQRSSTLLMEVCGRMLQTTTGVLEGGGSRSRLLVGVAGVAGPAAAAEVNLSNAAVAPAAASPFTACASTAPASGISEDTGPAPVLGPAVVLAAQAGDAAGAGVGLAAAGLCTSGSSRVGTPVRACAAGAFASGSQGGAGGLRVLQFANSLRPQHNIAAAGVRASGVLSMHLAGCDAWGASGDEQLPPADARGAADTSAAVGAYTHNNGGGGSSSSSRHAAAGHRSSRSSIAARWDAPRRSMSTSSLGLHPTSTRSSGHEGKGALGGAAGCLPPPPQDRRREVLAARARFWEQLHLERERAAAAADGEQPPQMQQQQQQQQQQMQEGSLQGAQQAPQDEAGARGGAQSPPLPQAALAASPRGAQTHAVVPPAAGAALGARGLVVTPNPVLIQPAAAPAARTDDRMLGAMPEADAGAAIARPYGQCTPPWVPQSRLQPQYITTKAAEASPPASARLLMAYASALFAAGSSHASDHTDQAVPPAAATGANAAAAAAAAVAFGGAEAEPSSTGKGGALTLVPDQLLRQPSSSGQSCDSSGGQLTMQPTTAADCSGNGKHMTAGHSVSATEIGQHTGSVGETNIAVGRAWHEVRVARATDGASGQRLLVVMQKDVTAKVEAERHIMKVSEAEHRLLEQIFPRHVLAYMTQQDGGAMTKLSQHELPSGLLRFRDTIALGSSVSQADKEEEEQGEEEEIGTEGEGLAHPRSLHTAASVAALWRPHVRDCNALATWHEEVTILFADIQGFTPMCKELPPAVVMTFLNALFVQFDSLVDAYGVYKVETIGDCYVVAGGLMHRDTDGMAAVQEGGQVDGRHADRVVQFGKAMLRAAAHVRMPTNGGPVRIRVGVHSGPVVSGVVGTRMPRFCLFGDTMNTASRMESTGTPGCIHVSQDTFTRLSGSKERWRPSGGIEVKGKGHMQTWVWAAAAPAAAPAAPPADTAAGRSTQC